VSDNGQVVFTLLADLVATLHAAFLVFLVVGGFLAWRWRSLFLVHLVVVAWAVAIVVIGFDCPLTPLEKDLLAAGGEPVYSGPFIDRYVADVLYPAEHTIAVRAVVGLVVLASWLGFAWRSRHLTAEHRRSPGRVTGAQRR
jgi:hypothetical protein